MEDDDASDISSMATTIGQFSLTAVPSAIAHLVDDQEIDKTHPPKIVETIETKAKHPMLEVLASNHYIDEGWRKQAFSETFESIEKVREFFSSGFGIDQNSKSKVDKPVSDKLSDPESWTPETFCSLFATVWLHKPTEKAMYTLEIDSSMAEAVQKSLENCGRKRMSSHLGRTGYSIPDFAVLQGYDELLVHFEKMGDRHILCLKAEGKRTEARNPLDLANHGLAYIHQRFTGEGLVRSLALRGLAKASPIVASRLAENYPPSYAALLKVLGFGRDKKVTARTMAQALFGKHGYHPDPPVDFESSTNKEIAAALTSFLKTTFPSSYFSIDAMREVEQVAERLELDGASRSNRIFMEVIIPDVSVLDEVVAHAWAL